MKPQTKTAQHTPGPWTHEDDPDTGDRVVIDENLMVICRRPNMFDANLIAAAPELLEAGKFIAQEINDALKPGSPHTFMTLVAVMRNLERRMSAAIAKAEGRE